MEPLQSAFASLGLNTYEAQVYFALLSRGGLTPVELAARSNVPRQRIYDVLDSLQGKGLCTSRDGAPRAYYAVNPTSAVTDLVQQRAAALEEEKANAARSGKLLMEQLLPLFQEGSAQSDPLAYIEVLNDSARIATRALALAQAATVSIKSCIKRPLILTREQNWRFIQEPLQRGVPYRALYERSALEDEELREWITTFRAGGQEIRVVAELPIKINSFDANTALVSMQDPVGGAPRFTALAIQHRDMVALLDLAFDRLWEQGEALK